MSAQQSNRRIYLDLLRIGAAFLVIFNHLPGYGLYWSNTGLKACFYLCLTMITRVNVPLFLMISGSLLLGRDEPYKDILKKRVKRILIVIVLFEVALYITGVLAAYVSGTAFQVDISGTVRDILGGVLKNAEAYWYLYAYTGMLLMLPFLRMIAKKMEKTEFMLLIVFHFCMASLLPMVNLALRMFGTDTLTISPSLTNTLSLATLSQLFYPLIGYYLDRKIDVTKMNKKQTVILAVIGVISVLIPVALTYVEGTTVEKEFTGNFVVSFDWVTAIVLFVLMKKICSINGVNAILSRCGHVLGTVGALTFGIYLLDPFLKITVWESFRNILEPHMVSLIVSVLWCVFSMVCGGVITWLLRKLPGLKKIL